VQRPVVVVVVVALPGLLSLHSHHHHYHYYHHYCHHNVVFSSFFDQHSVYESMFVMLQGM
jgi:hypothetical protein